MLVAEDGAQFWWTDSKIESVVTGQQAALIYAENNRVPYHKQLKKGRLEPITSFFANITSIEDFKIE
jgi:hypothetical protein